MVTGVDPIALFPAAQGCERSTNHNTHVDWGSGNRDAATPMPGCTYHGQKVLCDFRRSVLLNLLLSSYAAACAEPHSCD